MAQRDCPPESVWLSRCLLAIQTDFFSDAVGEYLDLPAQSALLVGNQSGYVKVIAPTLIMNTTQTIAEKKSKIST
jgi:hypothetical protein